MASNPALEPLLAHADWLARLARRLVADAAAADDLVQDVWVAALRRPPDPERPARPWLTAVVRRLAARRVRRDAARSASSGGEALRESPAADEIAARVEQERMLAGAVLELREPYRTVILERYYGEKTSAEIARDHGIPAGTVRTRLKRGLESLRERLDAERGGDGQWIHALMPLLKLGVRASPRAVVTVGGGTVAKGLVITTLVAATVVVTPWSTVRARFEAPVDVTVPLVEDVPDRERHEQELVHPSLGELRLSASPDAPRPEPEPEPQPKPEPVARAQVTPTPRVTEPVLEVLGRPLHDAVETTRKTVDAILEIQRDDSLGYDGKRKRVDAVVRERVDRATLAQLVLSKNWRKLDEAQQDEFADVFTDHLVLIYWDSIEAAEIAGIEITKDREEKRSKGRPSDWTVKTKANLGGGKGPVLIDYRLRQKAFEGERLGRWLVIDIFVEGESFVSTFRSQLAEVYSDGGAKHLIDAINGKNETRNKRLQRRADQWPPTPSR